MEPSAAAHPFSIKLEIGGSSPTSKHTDSSYSSIAAPHFAKVHFGRYNTERTNQGFIEDGIAIDRKLGLMEKI